MCIYYDSAGAHTTAKHARLPLNFLCGRFEERGERPAFRQTERTRTRVQKTGNGGILRPTTHGGHACGRTGLLCRAGGLAHRVHVAASRHLPPLAVHPAWTSTHHRSLHLPPLPHSRTAARHPRHHYCRRRLACLPCRLPCLPCRLPCLRRRCRRQDAAASATSTQVAQQGLPQMTLARQVLATGARQR